MENEVKMVPNDVLLDRFDDKVSQAIAEDEKFKVLVGKKQAHVEFQKYLHENKGRKLCDEDVKVLLRAAFLGMPLRYSVERESVGVSESQ